MKVNSKQLTADATALHRERMTVDLRRRTGATEIITAALPAIEQLRNEGITWDAIARALAKQGAVQGTDRQPLKGRRLSALISAIRKREARRARKLRRRPDLVPQLASPAVVIAPELTSKAHAPAAPAFSESALRAEAYANLQLLLKAQPK